MECENGEAKKVSSLCHTQIFLLILKFKLRVSENVD